MVFLALIIQGFFNVLLINKLCYNLSRIEDEEMLLKDIIYFILLFLSIIAIPLLIYTIKNKFVAKRILRFALSILIYILVGIMILPNVLYLDLGFEVFFLAMICVMASMAYIIVIIICGLRMHRLIDERKSKRQLIVIIITLLFPVIFFFVGYYKERMIIEYSDAFFIFESRGNGGFGNSEYFGYALNDGKLIKFSMGIAKGGKSMIEFMDKKTTYTTDKIDAMKPYEITINDEKLLITKEDQKYEIKLNNYTNNTFKRGYIKNYNK